MIGTRIEKPVNSSNYAQCAIWCNKNNATIVDMGDYYQVIEIVIPEKTLEDVKLEKLQEINKICDNILNQASSTYPQTEVLTFDQQIIEAKAYIVSNNVNDAPLLIALAAARGIELDDLVSRVIAKHDSFSTLSGIVIGQRQALEDRLDACETAEDVQLIEVNYTL